MDHLWMVGYISFSLHKVVTTYHTKKKMAVNSRRDSKRSEFPLPQFEETFPIVFQCKNCNNILGDSCAWVSSDRDLEMICINSKWFLC